jgi:hypothetical protein
MGVKERFELKTSSASDYFLKDAGAAVVANELRKKV